MNIHNYHHFSDDRKIMSALIERAVVEKFQDGKPEPKLVTMLTDQFNQWVLDRVPVLDVVAITLKVIYERPSSPEHPHGSLTDRVEAYRMAMQAARAWLLFHGVVIEQDTHMGTHVVVDMASGRRSPPFELAGMAALHAVVLRPDLAEGQP